MCKVFAMTNVSQVKVNTKLISTIRNEVCRHADQDGFGYAVLSTKGEIGGERTIRPLNFRPLINPDTPKVVENLPIVLKANNGFGVLDLSNAKSLIAHGRLSTNTVCLENTHPFTNGEVALIHNGVVNDPTSTLKNLTSTCDSEILLRYWERGGVEEVEKMVSGYYAFAVLDKHGLLHITRDDRADLFISYCRTVDSFIIATTAEIIRNVAKEMKWKIEHPEEILEKSYTVFDGNEIIKHRAITTRASTYGGSTYYGPHGGYSQRGSSTGTGYSSINDNRSSSASSNSSTPTNALAQLPGSTTQASRYAGEGAWDDYHYNEADPAAEPVPNYKELSGNRAATDSSRSSAATSSLGTGTTDQSETSSVSQSSLANSLMEGPDGGGDPDLDQRVDLIVSEVEDWRDRRKAGNDVF